MIKNILIIGGAGYIGSALAHTLQQLGHTVSVFDNLSTGSTQYLDERTRFTEGDITSFSELEKSFYTYKPDVVIHCAAKKSVRESETDPDMYFENNVLGTLNVLRCMEKYAVPHIIFSSTAALYAPGKSEPYNEHDDINPQSVYGTTKYVCENLITAFAGMKKINSYHILRYFNVAGDIGLKYVDDKAENIFPLLAKALKKKESFSIYGTDYETSDGTGVRDYIHLEDLVTAHTKCLDSESGIYNLGTTTGHSVRDVIEVFQNESGKEINVVEKERRSGDVASVLADASNAEKNLSWKATKSLEEMVRGTLDTYGL